ncbi:hypothetical protein FNF31_03833 [Cafeteria roenbergensis]|uniref:Response regulatory domain-containing protein n=1 Tax=Cafeteria roenbergensis TaxID=33653 RepID=A0A5A8D9Y4_CAFRO|nr:hypothetical protein FNF31_03833 [Cafeteria roenbergensis]
MPGDPAFSGDSPSVPSATAVSVTASPWRSSGRQFAALPEEPSGESDAAVGDVLLPPGVAVLRSQGTSVAGETMAGSSVAGWGHSSQDMRTVLTGSAVALDAQGMAGGTLGGDERLSSNRTSKHEERAPSELAPDGACSRGQKATDGASMAGEGARSAKAASTVRTTSSGAVFVPAHSEHMSGLTPPPSAVAAAATSGPTSGPERQPTAPHCQGAAGVQCQPHPQRRGSAVAASMAAHRRSSATNSRASLASRSSAALRGSGRSGRASSMLSNAQEAGSGSPIPSGMASARSERARSSRAERDARRSRRRVERSGRIPNRHSSAGDGESSAAQSEASSVGEFSPSDASEAGLKSATGGVQGPAGAPSVGGGGANTHRRRPPMLAVGRQGGFRIKQDPKQPTSAPGHWTRLTSSAHPHAPGIATAAGGAHAASAAIASGCCCLVVEDEASQRRGLCRLLRRQGIRVEEAADGVDALQALQRLCRELATKFQRESRRHRRFFAGGSDPGVVGTVAEADGAAAESDEARSESTQSRPGRAGAGGSGLAVAARSPANGPSPPSAMPSGTPLPSSRATARGSDADVTPHFSLVVDAASITPHKGAMQGVSLRGSERSTNESADEAAAVEPAAGDGLGTPVAVGQGPPMAGSPPAERAQPVSRGQSQPLMLSRAATGDSAPATTSAQHRLVLLATGGQDVGAGDGFLDASAGRAQSVVASASPRGFTPLAAALASKTPFASHGVAGSGAAGHAAGRKADPAASSSSNSRARGILADVGTVAPVTVPPRVVVFSDCNMPRMDGPGLVLAAASDPDVRALGRVFFVGVTGTPEDEKRFKDAGARIVISKPIGSAAVKAALHSALSAL